MKGFQLMKGGINVCACHFKAAIQVLMKTMSISEKNVIFEFPDPKLARVPTNNNKQYALSRNLYETQVTST